MRVPDGEDMGDTMRGVYWGYHDRRTLIGEDIGDTMTGGYYVCHHST